MLHRKVLRAVVGFVGFELLAAIVGRCISNRTQQVDDRSGDLRIVGVFGGRTFRSRSANLTKVSVVAIMGGVDVDLRQATLDPSGATLDLRAIMGGVQITVPSDWAVDAEITRVAGGIDLEVTPVDDLPADAPKLHVRAAACMGGGRITTDPRGCHTHR